MSYRARRESSKGPLLWALAVATGLTLVVGCGSAMKVATDFDREAEFDGLSTYAMIRPDSGERRAARPASERRIVEAVTRELEAKGYRSATHEPDFRVGFVVVVDAGMDEQTIYADERLGYVSSETVTRAYRQGTLVLFITDAVGEKVIWRGTASETFRDADQKTINRRIDEAVAEMLASFPPQG